MAGSAEWANTNSDMPLVTPITAMDIADIGIDKSNGVGTPDSGAGKTGGPKQEVPTTSALVPSRPPMQRNQPQPPPLQQPPPPPVPVQQQVPDGPTDSLSLMQLKRIVIDMPRVEPTAYAFVYEDTAPVPDELDEWFSYAAEEQAAISNARSTFEKRWQRLNSRKNPGDVRSPFWTSADEQTRQNFVEAEVATLRSPDVDQARASLSALLYLGLGVWGETADQDFRQGEPSDGTTTEGQREDDQKQQGVMSQLHWMRANASLICRSGGIQAIFDVLRCACLREWEDDPQQQQTAPKKTALLEVEVLELNNALTLMYLLVEAGRWHVTEGISCEIRRALTSLEPDYLLFIVKLLARLRWDESTDLPLRKIFLLFWKSTLLQFGGLADLEATKVATHESAGRTSNDDATTRITASPLDYHLFRQEITSKYPAYNPPPPLLPLESDNNSILPPLTSRPGRSRSSDPPLGIGPAAVNGNGSSILHQPVHIATPAPSPPPSPVGPGGKAGKKQNYQTNQNFPFLYPPLDASGTSLGGKGSAELQRKRWGGSDVPASILEAGELFAGRMRMTRAMQQLWDEREQFLKFERGWGGLDDGPKLNGFDERVDVEQPPERPERPAMAKKTFDDPDVMRRLEAVEAFYKNALPYLQSLVIVLLKVVLSNVTALITQPTSLSGQAGSHPSVLPRDLSKVNPRAQSKAKESNGRYTNDFSTDTNRAAEDVPAISVADLDAARSREITAKAVSGVLLLLLKWFKISHVLKFEYMTQLLLDSNYLPLILKLFAHQDLDRVVESETDHSDLGVFALCRKMANPQASNDSDEESEDEACPPPIIKFRREPPSGLPKDAASTAEGAAAVPLPAPEVGELGFPATEAAAEPITNFSWRNFYSSINYLRIMQKICKNKAHRNLLLVQYKSSTILKKALKIPQPQLRLYTLKLFKNQVPYCGRKWRQSNMRVITAVYLHCRPELRDDWLAGSDVDAEVEEALPLEQALRALTHWHNLKQYPEQMGAETGLLEEEQDFFIRELEKMDFGDDVGSAAEEMVGDGGLWEGPLRMEGW